MYVTAFYFQLPSKQGWWESLVSSCSYYVDMHCPASTWLALYCTSPCTALKISEKGNVEEGKLATNHSRFGVLKWNNLAFKTNNVEIYHLNQTQLFMVKQVTLSPATNHSVQAHLYSSREKFCTRSLLDCAWPMSFYRVQQARQNRHNSLWQYFQISGSYICHLVA